MNRCHICMKPLPPKIFNPIGLCEECIKPNQVAIQVDVQRPVISYETKTIVVDGTIVKRKKKKKARVGKKS